MKSVVGAWTLGIIAAGAALFIATTGATMLGGDSATARKGDRQQRVVHVACATTVTDSVTGCAELARSVDPDAKPAFTTVARTTNSMTKLIRIPVTE